MQNLLFPPEDYRYFDFTAAHAFAGEDFLAKAAFAADASMLAYARRGPARMTGTELAEEFRRAGLSATQFDHDNTSAVFATGGSFALLAFRGTEADQIQDVLTDLYLSPATESGWPVMMHRGFQQALNGLWSRLQDAIAEYRTAHPAAEICLTGHSLGGALATLAFSRLRDPGISLYTFGCPRVGNAAFRDQVSRQPSLGQYRFVNGNDPVTHMPLKSILFHHVPADYHRIDETGRITVCLGGAESLTDDLSSIWDVLRGIPLILPTGDLRRIPAPSGLVDHSPGRYCTRLCDYT